MITLPSVRFGFQQIQLSFCPVTDGDVSDRKYPFLALSELLWEIASLLRGEFALGCAYASDLFPQREAGT